MTAHSGYAGRAIDSIFRALHAAYKWTEGKMIPLRKSDSIAGHRSKLVHGETRKLSKSAADSLLRKLKEDKKRREKKRQLEHAR